MDYINLAALAFLCPFLSLVSTDKNGHQIEGFGVHHILSFVLFFLFFSFHAHNKTTNFAVKPCNSTEFSALLQALEAKNQCVDACLVFEFGKASFCSCNRGVNVLLAVCR